MILGLEYGQILSQIKIMNLSLIEKKDSKLDKKTNESANQQHNRCSSFSIAQNCYHLRNETPCIQTKSEIVETDDEDSSYNCLCLNIFKGKKSKKTPKDASR